ncbi:hypothetical protein B7463_g7081, partial [Scytalidium lignicola]
MVGSLDPRFKFMEADLSDMDEIWTVAEEAFETDAIWELPFKNCKKEDIPPWIMSNFAPRWSLPDITIYKIIEIASGRIVGWGGLQFPCVDRPLKEEELAIAVSHDLPPLLEGMDGYQLARQRLLPS